MAKKTKKTKTKKFYKVSFSISEKEKRELNRLCVYEKIGLKTLYKKAVRLYASDRIALIKQEEEYSKNQLSLFEEPPPFQNKLIF